MTSMRISPRFRGPAKSGNGGYVAGLIGTALAAVTTADPAARVRLLMPPPMESELELLVGPTGAKLTSAAGVVAEAVSVDADTLADCTVDGVAHEEALAAEAQYKGLANHPFPGCFVCGPDNSEGLQLKPGPLGNGRTACTWHPAADLAASDGLIDPVFVWAALDCPGGWAIDLEGRPSVLGQMSACIDARPQPGEPCVVMGRVLSEDGRKTQTASTLYDSDGRVLARAQHTWILVDPALFN